MTANEIDVEQGVELLVQQVLGNSPAIIQASVAQRTPVDAEAEIAEQHGKYRRLAGGVLEDFNRELPFKPEELDSLLHVPAAARAKLTDPANTRILRKMRDDTQGGICLSEDKIRALAQPIIDAERGLAQLADMHREVGHVQDIALLSSDSLQTLHNFGAVSKSVLTAFRQMDEHFGPSERPPTDPLQKLQDAADRFDGYQMKPARHIVTQELSNRSLLPLAAPAPKTSLTERSGFAKMAAAARFGKQRRQAEQAAQKGRMPEGLARHLESLGELWREDSRYQLDAANAKGLSEELVDRFKSLAYAGYDIVRNGGDLFAVSDATLKVLSPEWQQEFQAGITAHPTEVISNRGKLKYDWMDGKKDFQTTLRFATGLSDLRTSAPVGRLR